MTRHPRFTPTQEHGLWSVYRAGTLTTGNQWEHVRTDGRVKVQSLRSLASQGFVFLEELQPLQVSGANGRVYSSTVQWRAHLTPDGEQWIARQMTEIEGLTTPQPRVTL